MHAIIIARILVFGIEIKLFPPQKALQPNVTVADSTIATTPGCKPFKTP